MPSALLSKLKYPPGVDIKYKLTARVFEKGKLIHESDCGQVANDYSVLYWLSLLAPFISNASSLGLTALSAQSISSGSIALTVQTSATSSTNILTSPSLTVNSYSLGSNTSNSFQITVSGVISSACGSSCTPTYFSIGGVPPSGVAISVNPSSNSCNLTVSQGQTVQFTLTGSASATSSNVYSSSFVMAWAEMWAEVINAILGSSSPFYGKTVNWAGSGNAASSYYIYIIDTSGNIIGSYTTSPASSNNISSPSFSASMNSTTSITSGSLSLSFNFTAPSNDTISLVRFGFNLNASANSSGVTYMATTASLETSVGNINYAVTQGSVYGINVTENESTTVTT